ncbi:MAG: exodeoxyribonuclease I [Oceanococcaceae bacterium]
MGSFCFFDLETFGTVAGRDRVAQFAVQRTNAALEPMGPPVVEYCQPSAWPLPEPDACLVTGITPQIAQDRGLPEWRFCEQLLAALAGPDTCIVGYNSSHFDDTFVQHLCWRNFHDPYAWHWQDGNSRWDVLTLARAAFALRPDGVSWPQHADGTQSLKLEDLARANALPQPQAHDALGDVTATLALAQLLRERQPRLFDYALSLRDKRVVAEMIQPGEPLAHVSGKVRAQWRCLTLWLPVCPHPDNRNEWLGLDLRGPLAPWMELSPEELAERIFTAQDDLPEEIERPRMKNLAINRAPFLADARLITADVAERAHLDVVAAQEQAAVLRDNLAPLAEKLQAIMALRPEFATRDVEARLYDGFVPDADRRRAEAVRAAPMEDLAQFAGQFVDPRLEELLLRFRARHAPDTLTEAERAEWQKESRRQLEFAPHGGLTLEQYFQRLQVRAREVPEAQRELLRQLWRWGQEQASALGIALE